MDYERETWQSFRWHCPNCGKQVIGYKDKSGKIKVSCDSCKTVMIRITKGRRHDTIELYAPKNQVRIE